MSHLSLWVVFIVLLSLSNTPAQQSDTLQEIDTFLESVPDDNGVKFFSDFCAEEKLTIPEWQALLKKLRTLPDSSLPPDRIPLVYDALWSARDSISWRSMLVDILVDSYRQHRDPQMDELQQ